MNGRSWSNNTRSGSCKQKFTIVTYILSAFLAMTIMALIAASISSLKGLRDKVGMKILHRPTPQRSTDNASQVDIRLNKNTAYSTVKISCE